MRQIGRSRRRWCAAERYCGCRPGPDCQHTQEVTAIDFGIDALFHCSLHHMNSARALAPARYQIVSAIGVMRWAGECFKNLALGGEILRRPSRLTNIAII